MKTVGLIVILCAGILVLTVLLIPIGVHVQVVSYPDQGSTTTGKLRIGEIRVENDGWFTQTIHLPELAACMGDQEIPLDAWLSRNGEIVRGAGQLRNIRLESGEQGIIYIMASDATLYDKILLYKRQDYFSCLNPGTPLG